MKTAVQELIDWATSLQYNQQQCTDWIVIKNKAESLLQMEKQQIIDAWIATDNELQRMAAEQYYIQTYGSKGSDDHIVDTNEMVSSQTTSDKWKEYQDWLNEVPKISDEEITKLANEHILYNDSKRQWVVEGMKLYREQLKTK